DEPVDNIDQPLLAAALSESLEQAGRLQENTLIATNYGVCATLDGKFVAKAPDWMYVPQIWVAREEVRRSYTPKLQGDVPAIVIEFLSETEGAEYSIKPTYPPGKWFFYEQVLQIPQYAIFEPQQGVLEVYQLKDSGRYDLQQPNADNHYRVESLSLFLGVWQGTKGNRTGYWLRWWDDNGQMLPWGVESVEQERQRAEQERQRAEALAAQLRAAGIEPEV
ncbi:MAG: Uma2 family endonuclease, partial [Coleofasciculus sp. S288]|nr:Uma2 family endonuclease [Coleofasciculus sp. S288]